MTNAYVPWHMPPQEAGGRESPPSMHPAEGSLPIGMGGDRIVEMLKEKILHLKSMDVEVRYKMAQLERQHNLSGSMEGVGLPPNRVSLTDARSHGRQLSVLQQQRQGSSADYYSHLPRSMAWGPRGLEVDAEQPQSVVHEQRSETEGEPVAALGDKPPGTPLPKRGKSKGAEGGGKQAVGTNDENVENQSAKRAGISGRTRSAASNSATSTGAPKDPYNYDVHGCKVCRNDVDHQNLLLCDECNDGYHTHCLDPPLQSIPKGNFICDECFKGRKKRPIQHVLLLPGGEGKKEEPKFKITAPQKKARTEGQQEKEKIDGCLPCPDIGEGWTKKVSPRKTGNRVDTVYYSPDGQRFRGMAQVTRYLNGEAGAGPKKGSVSKKAEETDEESDEEEKQNSNSAGQKGAPGQSLASGEDRDGADNGGGGDEEETGGESGHKRVTVTVSKPSRDDDIGLGLSQAKGAVGVRVDCIPEGGLFAGTGLKVGMVIETVNGELFDSVAECAALMKEAEGELTVVAVDPAFTVPSVYVYRFERHLTELEAMGIKGVELYELMQAACEDHLQQVQMNHHNIMLALILKQTKLVQSKEIDPVVQRLEHETEKLAVEIGQHEKAWLSLRALRNDRYAESVKELEEVVKEKRAQLRSKAKELKELEKRCESLESDFEEKYERGMEDFVYASDAPEKATKLMAAARASAQEKGSSIMSELEAALVAPYTVEQLIL